MKYDVLRDVERKNEVHKRRRAWYRVVTVLATIVVLCTFYALILPAITLEKDPTCGVDAHLHEENCYVLADGAYELKCEILEHTHDDSCYADVVEESGVLAENGSQGESEPSGEGSMGSNTESAGENVSETSGESASENGTEGAADSETANTTESPAENSTDDITENTTEGATENSTEGMTESATETLTEAVTTEELSTQMPAETEGEPVVYTYSDDNVQVEVKLPEDSEVPKDAYLSVTPVESDDDLYEEMKGQAEEALEAYVRKIRMYDISFYTEDGEYIPVADQAKVTIRFPDTAIKEDANVAVLHYEEDESAPTILDEVSVEEQTVSATMATETTADNAEENVAESAVDKEENAAEATAENEDENAAAGVATFSLRGDAGESASADGEDTDGNVSGNEITDSTNSENENNESEENTDGEMVTATVVEFVTQGFSTFAVVDYVTEVYETEIVTAAGGGETPDRYNYVTGLDEKTYVISTVTEPYLYSLSSDNLVIQQDEDGNSHAKLGAIEVVEETDTTVTTVASEDLLWKFIDATPDNNNDGIYYIQSVETEQYLNILDIYVLTTGNEPQPIEVVHTVLEEQNNQAVIGLRVKYGNIYYYVNLHGNAPGGDLVFHTWAENAEHKVDLSTTHNNQLRLSLYEADDEKEDKTGNTTSPAGRGIYIIAGVNTSTHNPKDAVILTSDNAGYPQYGNITSEYAGLGGIPADDTVTVDDENGATGITITSNELNQFWKMIDDGDASADTFYLQSLATGKYLNLSGTKEKGLMTDVPQSITREAKTYANETDVTNAVVLSATDNGTKYYINLFGNRQSSDFTVSATNETEDRGNDMMLFEQSLIPGLEGKSYLISNVNFSNNPDIKKAVTLTSSFVESSTVTLQGKETDVVINNYAVESATVTDDDMSDVVWQFETTGTLGTYYIRAMATGQYLSITTGGLGFTNEKQEIEVVAADTSTQNRRVKYDVICLRTVDENPLYVQLNNNKETSRTFVVSNDTGTDNGGNHFVLTEYDYPLVTNLGNKVYYIVGANNNNGNGNPGNGNPPALASTGDDDTMRTGENLQNVNLSNAINNGDGKYIAEVNSTAADDNGNLGWYFEETKTPGIYHLMAANTTNTGTYGQYLRIDENTLKVEETNTPQDIEVVKGIVTRQDDIQEVICLRAKGANGQYYYVYLQGNNADTGNFYSGNTYGPSSRYTHLALVEIPTVNDVITQIQDLLDNLVPLTDENGEIEGYEFSDEAVTGSATPGNSATNQDGDGFVERYDLAQAYREEMKEKARAALDAYALLENDEKQYVVNYEELIKLKWLLRTPIEVPSDPVNATVRLFNYTNAVNNVDLATLPGNDGESGFTFYHRTTNYNPYTVKDKESGINSGNFGANNTGLTMNPKLVKGYPYINAGAINGISTTVDSLNVNGSLQYLFDTSATEYFVDEMEEGGGLFQYRKDDGYYYYDSSLNSVYYDETRNDGEFVLYDTLIRPMYIHGTDQGGNENYYTDTEGKQISYNIYNFLPFNNPAEAAVFDQESVDLVNGYPTAYLNEPTDVWFGMNIEYDFIMPEGGKVRDEDGDLHDMVFKFKGDDDVLVYIDGVLVMDLSGVHGAETGTIDFATGTVTIDATGEGNDGTTYLSGLSEAGLETAPLSTSTTDSTVYTLKENTIHTLQFYYLERGGNVSYNSIEFNITSLPNDYLFIGKGVEYDENLLTVVEDGKNYTFRVVQSTEDGIVLDAQGKEITENTEVWKAASYFKPGTTFEIWRGGAPTGETGIVDSDGRFSLPIGSAAVFADVLDESVRANPGCSYYVVQEMITETEINQYAGIQLDQANPETVEFIKQTTGDEVDSAYFCYTGHLYNGEEAADNAYVIQNVVDNKPGELRITKQVQNDNPTNNDTTQEFTVQVLIGDERIVDTDGTMIVEYEPLPKGTKYTISSQNSTTTVDGEVGDDGYITISDGQTITIPGFLIGTNFSVKEVLGDKQEYLPEYTWGVLDKNGVITYSEPQLYSVTGEFGVTQKEDQNVDQNEDQIEDLYEAQTIAVNIKNDDYDFAVSIPIEKQLMNTTKGGTYTFLAELCKKTGEEEVEDAEGNKRTRPIVEPIGIVAEKTLTVDVDGSMIFSEPEFNFGGVLGTETTFYYKIYEQPGTDELYYDKTFYIVGIEVVLTPDDQGHKGTATLTEIWKNGTGWMETGTEEDPTILSFVNHGLTSFKVTKSVSGSDGATKKFRFTVVITQPDGTMEEHSFELGNAETKVIDGVAYGSTATVTEEDVQDYFTALNAVDKYEAEDGILLGNAELTQRGTGTNANDENAVGWLGVNADSSHPVQGQLQITVNADKDYTGLRMLIRYSTDGNRYLDITKIQSETEKLIIMEDLSCPSTEDFNDFADVYLDISLVEGENVFNFTNDGVAPNIDYIEIIYPNQDSRTITKAIYDDTTIHFYNTEFYELPESGGIGTTPYMIGGLIATLSALTTLLLYNRHYSKKHRKKVNNSS